MKDTNPSNVPEKRKADPSLIPMDMPTLSLGVPELQGHHLHWFLAKNVARALRAGYSHVTVEDGLEIDNGSVADSKAAPGGTDLGTNISVLAGSDVDPVTGDPDRLYLMKCPLDVWRKVEASRDARNEQTAAALRGGTSGAENDPDRMKRYLKDGQDLFLPKRKPQH
jgi:hypothetical protein